MARFAWVRQCSELKFVLLSRDRRRDWTICLFVAVCLATEEAKMTQMPIVGPNALNPNLLSPEDRWDEGGRVLAQGLEHSSGEMNRM